MALFIPFSDLNVKYSLYLKPKILPVFRNAIVSPSRPIHGFYFCPKPNRFMHFLCCLSNDRKKIMRDNTLILIAILLTATLMLATLEYPLLANALSQKKGVSRVCNGDQCRNIICINGNPCQTSFSIGKSPLDSNSSHLFNLKVP